MTPATRDAATVTRNWARETADNLKAGLKGLRGRILDDGHFKPDLPEPPWWWYPVQDTAEGLEKDLRLFASGDAGPEDFEVMHAQAWTLKGLADRMDPRYDTQRKYLRAAAVDAADIARRWAEGGES